jgi:hypothetical protein
MIEDQILMPIIQSAMFQEPRTPTFGLERHRICFDVPGYAAAASITCQRSPLLSHRIAVDMSNELLLTTCPR